jgi:hypothetical protein
VAPGCCGAFLRGVYGEILSRLGGGVGGEAVGSRVAKLATLLSAIANGAMFRLWMQRLVRFLAFSR